MPAMSTCWCHCRPREPARGVAVSMVDHRVAGVGVGDRHNDRTEHAADSLQHGRRRNGIRGHGLSGADGIELEGCTAGHDQNDPCGRRDGSFRHRPSRWARQDRDGGSTHAINSPPASQRTSQSPTSATRAGLAIGANIVARRAAVDAPKRAAAIRHSNARRCSTPCSRPCLRPCAKPCSRPSRSHCLGHSPTRSTNVASSNVRAGGTAAPAGARRSAICRTQSARARCRFALHG